MEKADEQPVVEIPKDDSNVEELLKSLNLKETEIEALKGNENLLNVLTHSLDAKRSANAEAKKYREKLEEQKTSEEAASKAALEKKGEFEKLYQEANEKLSQKDVRIKEALTKGELSRLAGKHGLAKMEYLRLLDTTSIEVDVDNATITGADEVFEQFKTNNPELFKQLVPSTDNGQPSMSKAPVGEIEKLKQLEATATQSRLPRDLAAFKSKKNELQTKGLI